MGTLIQKSFFIEGFIEDLQGFERPNEQGWNGWACPLLDINGVKKVQEALEDDMTGEDSITITEDGKVILDSQDFGRTELEPIEIEGKTLYDFGLGWTWESK